MRVSHRLPSWLVRAALLLFLSGVTAAGCKARSEAAVDRPPAAPEDHPGGRLAFALLSPHAGDTLLEGQSYVVRWVAPDSFRINLGAVMGGKDRGYLLADAPATPDSLVWTVPEGFVTGFGMPASDLMRLRLENAADPNQWTEAGPFTIRGAPR